MQTPTLRLPSDTLVLIPALNEEESLPITLKVLLEYVDAHNVLVISDGSRDRTVQIARESGVGVLELPINVGVGGAVRAGMRFAARNNFNYAIQFDADLQHDPKFLMPIRQELERCDVVVGSRFLRSNPYKISPARRFATWILSGAVSRRVGMHLTDVTSGYRGAGREAIAIFNLEYPSQYLADTVESLVLCHDRGLVIREISTPMNQRIAGNVSHGIWKSTLHLFRVMLVLVSTFQFKLNKSNERVGL